MKRYIILSLLFAGMSGIISCRKDDDLGEVGNLQGLGGDIWVKSDIDDYIYTNLTAPYNISVSYKWDQLALGQVNRNVAPVKEEKIRPVIEAMKRIWVEPYVAEFGVINFKKYCPKFFTFAGSSAYGTDGTTLLGLAGGGRQIYLFQLNYYINKTMAGFKASDTAVQKITFLTIQHEFAHIFDQTKARPFEFDQVGQGFYSADWINNSDVQARSEGFITPYASSQPGEDFAEMVSFMLVEGQAGMDKIINSITGTSSRGTTDVIAKARLNQKIQVLTKYFKDTWNIDLPSLQTRVRTAVVGELY